MKAVGAAASENLFLGAAADLLGSTLSRPEIPIARASFACVCVCVCGVCACVHGTCARAVHVDALMKWGSRMVASAYCDKF